VNLRPVGGRDDDDALGAVDAAGFEEFDEGGEGDAGMGAIEHAGLIAEGGGIGEFGFGGLFDDAVELLERADGFLDTDGVADLDGAGEGLAGLDRLVGIRSH
jgi:hypothetical protein